MKRIFTTACKAKEIKKCLIKIEKQIKERPHDRR